MVAPTTAGFESPARYNRLCFVFGTVPKSRNAPTVRYKRGSTIIAVQFLITDSAGLIICLSSPAKCRCTALIATVNISHVTSL